MVLRPRGFSQIYVRIGLEEQSKEKTRQARKQSRHKASKMCGK